MDWTTIITAVLSLVAGGGLTALLTAGNERMKGKIDIMHQLADECADKSRKIRELTDEVIAGLKEQHLLEMELLCKRCDKAACRFRRPPLPWFPSGEDSDGDGLPDSDPEPVINGHINSRTAAHQQ